MQVVPLAARTTSGAGEPFWVRDAEHASRRPRAIIIVNVTAAAAAASDTLYVLVQHSIDEGTTWEDFIRIGDTPNTIVGNGGPKKIAAIWSPDFAMLSSYVWSYPRDLSSPGSPIEASFLAWPLWRVRWIISGATASFTFSVDVKTMLG